eukprot:GHVH01001706.1.p1 GENE.GHVH01001706.1~~GHVH01001706.1.p1  ORF type:complete len:180 (+),score=26.24 GHVH01001706.1:116-655(+)
MTSKGSQQAWQRLIRDFKNLNNDPPQGVNASPEGEDIYNWTGIIQGPEGSPWEGGAFKLTMKFPDDYPMKPPEVTFVTPIFHPNVYNNGSICLDILQNLWAPVFDVSGILMSIQSLLNDPNPDSPANNEAAQYWNNDRREYHRRVQQICRDCWQHESLKDLAQEDQGDCDSYEYVDESG